MEVKEWTYEEIPEFTEEVDGAHTVQTTGDEMGGILCPQCGVC